MMKTAKRRNGETANGERRHDFVVMRVDSGVDR
jgi:hypothetical protein